MSNRISEFASSLHPTEDAPQADISQVESLIAMGAAVAGGLLARQILKTGWTRTMGKEPPLNPASRDVDWQDALLWGAASGALVGALRIMSRRTASSAYRRYFR